MYLSDINKYQKHVGTTDGSRENEKIKADEKPGCGAKPKKGYDTR